MGLAVVAIIGRPNVGKSSLLNALSGKMISIVEPTAGVTRDRVSTFIERNDRYFELVDTGGYGIDHGDQLKEHIQQQILRAIESANLALFMVDIREGLVPLDKEISQLLHKHGLDVIGVANKADSASMFPAAAEFSELGFGEFLCISAKNNLNKNVLLDRIFDKLATLASTDTAPPQSVMKIAIVGKRNTGKSAFLNAIVGSERVIVSEIPGTTRDAIDVQFEKDGKTFTIIDTPGIRKKGKLADSIEFYSYVRATRAIRRADVVLLLIDATEPVSQVDKKLGSFIAQEYKSCIIVVNKWDLAKGSAVTGDYDGYLAKSLPGLSYAPIAFTTATEAKNVQSVLDLATEIFKQATIRIPTHKLNQAFEAIKAERASKRGTGWAKIYYATQITTNPVTIVMFVNNPELFDDNFRRFIVGRLREVLPFQEVPIRLLARPRTRDQRRTTSDERRGTRI